MSETSPFLGIVSGERRRAHAEVANRADRIASGLAKIGVRQGDCVCMLMRNDIAFLEAAYAAMRLGAYGVPINWHFKPEEINYILGDTGTSVLMTCRHAARPARCDPERRHRAQRADAAGDPVQLQDQSRSSEDAGLRD
ncbi:acyl-CoA synthetase (AMP-forming)/AMP-acid ligase II [Bradyrhizobium japonicum]|nr:AMP-binding protein [Bradyrhizobium japonicum]MCP1777687.1 acyl-CoA synthetase (AMP-forming)/AMP-acid ligase II [Bradyrhizobium japonicum]